MKPTVPAVYPVPSPQEEEKPALIPVSSHGIPYEEKNKVNKATEGQESSQQQERKRHKQTTQLRDKLAAKSSDDMLQVWDPKNLKYVCQDEDFI